MYSFVDKQPVKLHFVKINVFFSYSNIHESWELANIVIPNPGI